MVARPSTGIAMVAGGLAVVAAPLEHEGEGGGPGGEVVVALAAPEGAATTGFSTDALSAPSDVPFTLAFENADPAVPHNVVIYDGPDAEAPQLFRGRTGHGSRDGRLRRRAARRGRVLLQLRGAPDHDDGHDDSGARRRRGGGGGGEGITVVAADIAFDTDTIELPADAPTKITLDNQDAGTPHNIAIYTDESARRSRCSSVRS